MMPRVRVRFAPAPTGSLHVGGARTALFNHLFARHAGGEFVLRSEDTDAARSSLDSERIIQDDLRWLGLTWDEGPDIGGRFGPYRQTDRLERYAAAAAMLLAAGAAYRCWCTPADLEAERVHAQARGEAPRYSGRCRDLTASQTAAFEAGGRKPAIRFRMPERDVHVEDLVRGSVHFPARSIGDFVIVRSDGVAAYNFAVVVDDAAMEITHVLRGDEHLPNTPRQVAVYEALEQPIPLFAHLSMILAPDHQKLSKRHGATAVAEYREQGYLPAALVNYLALLGWSPGDDRELFTLDELVARFTLERVAKSPAVFDAAKLRWFNAHYVRALPPRGRADMFARWAEKDPALASLPSMRDPAWLALLGEAIADHVEVLADVGPAVADALAEPAADAAAASGDALTDPAARALLDEIAGIAESCADVQTFGRFVSRDALADFGRRHGLKGRALYRPIRIAITGKEHGIELPLLLPLVGPAAVAARIRRALARVR